MKEKKDKKTGKRKISTEAEAAPAVDSVEKAGKSKDGPIKFKGKKVVKAIDRVAKKRDRVYVLGTTLNATLPAAGAVGTETQTAKQLKQMAKAARRYSDALYELWQKAADLTITLEAHLN